MFIILQDHWTELLQGKLQLSKDIRVEKLRVEHFLSRLDILMEPATLSFVKSLQARYSKPSMVMMLLVAIIGIVNTSLFEVPFMKFEAIYCDFVD